MQILETVKDRYNFHLPKYEWVEIKENCLPEAERKALREVTPAFLRGMYHLKHGIKVDGTKIEEIIYKEGTDMYRVNIITNTLYQGISKH